MENKDTKPDTSPAAQQGARQQPRTGARVIVEGFNGSEWVKLTDVVPATLDRAGQVVELQVAEDGIVKVRLSYEKSGGNCSIDDVACVAGGKVTERVFVVEDREETGTSAVVDGLTEGTVYSYYVKAKNDQFVSEPSNIILAKPKAPLAKPQVLPATDVSDWGFRANWEKVEGAEGYRIKAYTLHTATADENYSFTNSYFDRIQLGDEYTIDNPYIDFDDATAVSADGYLDCAGWNVINPAYATGYMGMLVSSSGSRFMSPFLDLSKGEVTVAFSAVAKGGVTLEVVLVDATTEDGKLIGSEEVTVGDTESEFTVTLPQGTSESVLTIEVKDGAANYVFFSSMSVSQQMKEGDTMAVPYLIDWTEKNTYYVKTDKYEGTDDFAYEVEAYRMSEGFVEISPRSEMMVVERHSSVSEDVRTEGRAYADGTVIRNEILTTPAEPSRTYAYISDTLPLKAVISEVTGAVQQAVSEALTYYLEEHPKEAKMICDKVILAATARIAARKARESVQRKNPMSGGGLPGKLADCSNKDPKECEIFLVEGDSAGGSAKQGRNRFTQAILPLRGKILNVEKVMWHKVFESESVMNIIQSIGVRFGVDGEGDKEANIDKLRYDKIIIMTDADVDGSHIDTLIMTLFYRFMPKVIQEGHLYIATPPLYLCTYKNKVKEYCYTDQQRQAFLDKYGEGVDDGKSIHTQRYKGLGEMNPEQLWETTMNPETRLLKQVTIENAAEADEIFSMLMGDDVEPRRQFIEQNATYANIDA